MNEVAEGPAYQSRQILMGCLTLADDLRVTALICGLSPKEALDISSRDFKYSFEVEIRHFYRDKSLTSRYMLSFWLGDPMPGRLPERFPAERPYKPRHPIENWTPRLRDADWWPLRARVLREEAFVCAYCGDEATCVDHVHPLCRGGTNDRSNLRAACMPCNSSKQDKLLSEWRGRL